MQLDDHHIISTLKWSQNRISTLNDLVTEELSFLWIVPNIASVPNIEQTECSSINMSLYENLLILFIKVYILHIVLFQTRLNY